MSWRSTIPTTITPKGRTLARIYGEGDLLVGESLSSELFDGLSPGQVAKAVAGLKSFLKALGIAGSN